MSDSTDAKITVKLAELPADVYLDARERKEVIMIEHCDTCHEDFRSRLHIRRMCVVCNHARLNPPKKPNIFDKIHDYFKGHVR